MRKVFISLGNENRADNKVELDGKEIDIKGVGYLLFEFTAGNVRWIMAKKPPATETIILSTPLETKKSDTK